MLKLKLELPKEQMRIINGQEMILYTVEDWGKILEIYASYLFLADHYIETRALKDNMDNEIKVLEDELTSCNDTLRDVDTDRKFAYRTIDSTRKLYETDLKKAKISKILWVGGALVVGFGLGFTTGYLVAKYN